MTLAFATDAPGLGRVPRAALERRFKAAGMKTRYYTSDIHVGAFELPPFIAELAAKTR